MKETFNIHKNKIILITEYAFENQNSTGYYWSKIIENTYTEYKSITVICREPKNLGKGDLRINYEYIDIKPYELGGVLKRINSQIKMAFNITIKLHHSIKKGDIVFTGTNPIFFTCLTPILKKLIRFKWILIVHDLFPNYLKPYKIIKNKFIYSFVERLSNFIYENADHIIVIGRDMKEILDERRINIKKITVIQNWANPDEIHALEKEQNPIIKKLGWENLIVFGFFGNIGNLQGIRNILDAIKKVTNNQAAFLFIGTGKAVVDVEEFIKANSKINIKYHGPIPMQDKSIGLTACDIAIVSLEKQMLGVGVPSKAYFSMAAKRPLLAILEKDSEISQMIHEENIGWQCDPDQPEKLAKLIDLICEKHLYKSINNPREALKKKYSEDIALKKISLVINDLTT